MQRKYIVRACKWGFVRRFVWLFGMGVTLLAMSAGVAIAADLGTAFTYQGRLVKNGTPVNDTCTFTFRLWNDDLAGSQVGTSPISAVPLPVAAGLFACSLDFGPAAINGQARWLEIEVQCPGDGSSTVLNPRIELTPVPHALALPGLYTQQNATSANLIGGFVGNSVTAGAVGATIAGGGNSFFVNRVADDYGTIGGGVGNLAGNNTGPTTDSTYATVGGGFANDATGNAATVGGGAGNEAVGYGSTVAGGETSDAIGGYSTVAGGRTNEAKGEFSAIGGGEGNTVLGSWSTIAGGAANAVSKGACVGGVDDLAPCVTNSDCSLNVCLAFPGADDSWATVVGGKNNIARGTASTVPGGESNEAGGNFSFAAGHRAKVRNNLLTGDAGGDEGTFVWADDSAAVDFVSTGPNQFLIRATNGVGINTNAPTATLHLGGAPGGTNGIRFPDGTLQLTATAGDGDTLASLQCSDGQVAKWDSMQFAWVCADDNAGVGDGDTLADLECMNGQVPKWNSMQTVWECADTSGGNTLDQAYDQGGPGAGRIITADAGAVVIEDAGGLVVAGTIECGNTITIDGTTSAQRISSSENLEIHLGVTEQVTGHRVVRLENDQTESGGTWISPNILHGWESNLISAGATGVSVGGGGGTDGANVWEHRVTDTFGTIGGGADNHVGNGNSNPTDARWATIGGGASNRARGQYSTIGGGSENQANTDVATVCGGDQNQATALGSAVCGGGHNTATGNYAVAAGGWFNNAIGNRAAVLGGESNSAHEAYSVVVGGYVCNAYGSYSNVAGGRTNNANAQYSTIGGGNTNEANATAATVSGGQFNAASGVNSSVPGGLSNRAGGDYSFAGGRQAIVRDAAAAGDSNGDEGTFMWADSTNVDLLSTGPDQFLVRAKGGATIYSDAAASTGVTLAAGGGSWASVSDRNLKDNVKPIDPRDVLARLVEVPITTWNYNSQDPTIRHIGPMAQDFHAAFGVGEEETKITSIDSDGVALAAIQGVNQILQEKDCEIQELRSEISDLREMVKALIAKEGGSR